MPVQEAPTFRLPHCSDMLKGFVSSACALMILAQNSWHLVNTLELCKVCSIERSVVVRWGGAGCGKCLTSRPSMQQYGEGFRLPSCWTLLWYQEVMVDHAGPGNACVSGSACWSMVMGMTWERRHQNKEK